MKPLLNILSTTLIAANIVVATPAIGDSMGSCLPPETIQGNVSFVSGGIGQSEAMTFQNNAKHFPLEIEFVMKDDPRNAFLANVNVVIRDYAGKAVLRTVSQGPFLLATLPQGKYWITANLDGIIQREAIHVRDNKHVKTVLVWPKSTRLDSND